MLLGAPAVWLVDEPPAETLILQKVRPQAEQQSGVTTQGSCSSTVSTLAPPGAAVPRRDVEAMISPAEREAVAVEGLRQTGSTAKGAANPHSNTLPDEFQGWL